MSLDEIRCTVGIDEKTVARWARCAVADVRRLERDAMSVPARTRRRLLDVYMQLDAAAVHVAALMG